MKKYLFALIFFIGLVASAQNPQYVDGLAFKPYTTAQLNAISNKVIGDTYLDITLGYLVNWTGTKWRKVDDRPIAVEVPFTPYLTIAGTNVQAALELIKNEVDNLSASGVTDGDKGDIQVTANGATWTVKDGVIDSDAILNGSISNVDYGQRSIDSDHITYNSIEPQHLVNTGDLPEAGQIPTRGLTADGWNWINPVTLDNVLDENSPQGITNQAITQALRAQDQAEEIPVDVSNFNGNLNVFDNDIQKALDKIDNLMLVGSGDADDQTLSLNSIGNRQLTIVDGNSVDLTSVEILGSMIKEKDLGTNVLDALTVPSQNQFVMTDDQDGSTFAFVDVQIPTVDQSLQEFSANAIANTVVFDALNTKVDKNSNDYVNNVSLTGTLNTQNSFITVQKGAGALSNAVLTGTELRAVNNGYTWTNITPTTDRIADVLKALDIKVADGLQAGSGDYVTSVVLNNAFASGGDSGIKITKGDGSSSTPYLTGTQLKANVGTVVYTYFTPVNDRIAGVFDGIDNKLGELVALDVDNVKTTGDQLIQGVKQFSEETLHNRQLRFTWRAPAPHDNGGAIGYESANKYYFTKDADVIHGTLDFSGLTTFNRNYQFPDKDGTFALLSDLAGAGGTVNSVVAGTNIAVNATDPANPVVSAVDVVNTTGDQTVAGEKTFSAPLMNVSGRLGVGGIVPFGGGRLGDSDLQSATMDTKSLNFKDNAQNTIAAMFLNPTGTVLTIKGFDDSVMVTDLTSKAAIEDTEDAESTIANTIEMTNGAVYINDQGVQHYPGAVTPVANNFFQVLQNKGGGARKPYWFGRYDGTTYDEIFSVDNFNQLSFNNPAIAPEAVNDNELATLAQTRYITATTTAIDLTRNGQYYSAAVTSPATEYTLANGIDGGYAEIFINAPTEPTIFNIQGADQFPFTQEFIPDQDMLLVIKQIGGAYFYYYVQLYQAQAPPPQ